MGYKQVIIFILFLVSLPALSQSTITAASCNQTDVNSVINGPSHIAVNGDTIVLPPGTCTWASGITVPSNIGITITGTGIPNSGGGTVGAPPICTATDVTVTSGAVMVRMTPSIGNALSRLSCMEIDGGTGGGVILSILGTCSSGGCPNLRMDNLTLNNWAGHPNVGISFGLTAIGDMFGVLDHNTINGSAGNYLQLVEQSNASFLGVGFYGDNSWAQPPNYGSGNFLFFENNDFENAGATENEGTAGGLQNEGGGRVVVRFNTFNILDNLNFSLGWHGTESSGRPRSTAFYEYYENTWSCNSTINGCPPIIGARGGTGLEWGNTMSATVGSTFNVNLQMNTYRTQGSPAAPWGACDGSTPYDTNDGTTYFSGTISSSTSNTITVAGTPWSTNQWVSVGSPYSIHDTTQNNGSEIISNTTNTITFQSTGGPGQYVPTNGDAFQILRATVCIDQAGGRGNGVLYSGTTPASVPANQVLSPTYMWLHNVTSGNSPVSGSDTGRVIQNRDWYSEINNQAAQTSATSPFDGTTAIGFGHGTFARMPTTCTTGVGYWATDQGSWNLFNSIQGQLYLCTAPNTWTLSYTPFTYPHPIDGASAFSANFNNRNGTGDVIPATGFGTNTSGLSGTSPLSLITSAGLNEARLSVDVNQNCPAGVCGTLSVPIAQLNLLCPVGFKVLADFVRTPSNLGTSTCTPPTSPSGWATLVNTILNGLNTAFPGCINSVEIRNEPDLGGSPDWCPSTGTALSNYQTLIATAGPNISSANPTLKVGGPALCCPVANGTTWANGVLSSWPGINFFSYHTYLGTQTTWANYWSAMQNATTGNGAVAQNMISAVISAGGSTTPVWNTEYNNASAASDCCRNVQPYAFLWNAMYVQDMLNLKNSYGANRLHDLLFYYSSQATSQNKCLVGFIDAGMDCNSTSLPQVAYPQLYAYSLIFSPTYLNLQAGGHLATAIMPASTVSSLNSTAFYTSTGDAMIITNPSTSDALSQSIEFDNTGYTSMVATKYILNSANQIITVSNVPISGGIVTADIPALSVVAIQVQQATTSTTTFNGKVSIGGFVKVN